MLAHLRRCRKKTDPGNLDAQAFWLWSVPSGAAIELELDLRPDFVKLQVLVLKLLQESWFLDLETTQLFFLVLGLLDLWDLVLGLLGVDFLGQGLVDLGLVRLKFWWPVLVLVKLGMLNQNLDCCSLGLVDWQ